MTHTQNSQLSEERTRRRGIKFIKEENVFVRYFLYYARDGSLPDSLEGPSHVTQVTVLVTQPFATPVLNLYPFVQGTALHGHLCIVKKEALLCDAFMSYVRLA